MHTVKQAALKLAFEIQRDYPLVQVADSTEAQAIIVAFPDWNGQPMSKEISYGFYTFYDGELPEKVAATKESAGWQAGNIRTLLATGLGSTRFKQYG